MRNTPCATALVLATLLGAGCKHGPNLVGKWTGTAQGQPIAVEFKPDGTMTVNTKRGSVDVTETHTYKLDGDKITDTVKDLDMKGVPPGREALVAAFKSKAVGRTETGKLVFTGDDQVSMTGDKGDTVALTRVKEGS